MRVLLWPKNVSSIFPKIRYILGELQYAGSTDCFPVVYRKIRYGWHVCYICLFWELIIIIRNSPVWLGYNYNHTLIPDYATTPYRVGSCRQCRTILLQSRTLLQSNPVPRIQDLDSGKPIDLYSGNRIALKHPSVVFSCSFSLPVYIWPHLPKSLLVLLPLPVFIYCILMHPKFNYLPG